MTTNLDVFKNYTNRNLDNLSTYRVCDEDEVAGCTDDTATNYDASATEEDGSCEYDTTGGDCELPGLFAGNTGANMTIMLLPSHHSKFS